MTDNNPEQLQNDNTDQNSKGSLKAEIGYGLFGLICASVIAYVIMKLILMRYGCGDRSECWDDLFYLGIVYPGLSALLGIPFAGEGVYAGGRNSGCTYNRKGSYIGAVIGAVLSGALVFVVPLLVFFNVAYPFVCLLYVIPIILISTVFHYRNFNLSKKTASADKTPS